MAHIVGPKGQVVIAKEIREQLGVRPGFETIQVRVDDHVEVYFVPPEHDRSLLGILARHTSVRIPSGDAWERARESAWEDELRERFDPTEPER